MQKGPWQLSVSSYGDALREERLTRTLCQKINEHDGVHATLTQEERATQPGQKGFDLGPLTINVDTLLPAVLVYKLLCTVIQESGKTLRESSFKTTYREHLIEIDGMPNPQQIKLFEKIVSKIDETADAEKQ